MKHKGGIFLKILSPGAQIAGRMVGQVRLPGAAGPFTVLEGHANTCFIGTDAARNSQIDAYCCDSDRLSSIG